MNLSARDRNRSVRRGKEEQGVKEVAEKEMEGGEKKSREGERERRKEKEGVRIYVE